MFELALIEFWHWRTFSEGGRAHRGVKLLVQAVLETWQLFAVYSSENPGLFCYISWAYLFVLSFCRFILCCNGIIWSTNTVSVCTGHYSHQVNLQSSSSAHYCLLQRHVTWFIKWNLNASCSVYTQMAKDRQEWDNVGCECNVLVSHMMIWYTTYLPQRLTKLVLLREGGADCHGCC